MTIWLKSASGSSPALRATSGTVRFEAELESSSVWPSPSACATKAAPRALPLPGLFSMMKGCRNTAWKWLVTSRAAASEEPPGAAGTTMRTRRAGQSCAEAGGEGSRTAAVRTIAAHPPLQGEGRTAEGSPGRGGGDAAYAGHGVYAEALSPPPGPLTRADLPPPGGGGDRCASRNCLAVLGERHIIISPPRQPLLRRQFLAPPAEALHHRLLRVTPKQPVVPC